MTLQKVEAGALEKVARARPMPRSMRDYDVDDDYTEALVNMIEVADPSMYIRAEKPGLACLTRYAMDRDNDCFKIQDVDQKFRDWEKVDSLEGVILDLNFPYRALRKYQEFDESRENPILCSSADMLKGIGNPGVDCKTCQFSQWPTDEEKALTGKRRPDCADRFRIFFKSLDEETVSLVELPGSFRRNITSFEDELLRKGLNPWDVVTQLTLGHNSDRSFVEFEILATVNRENEEVAKSINSMRQCILALVIQMASWHLRAREDEGDDTLDDIENWPDDLEGKYTPEGHWVPNPNYVPPAEEGVVEGTMRTVDNGEEPPFDTDDEDELAKAGMPAGDIDKAAATEAEPAQEEEKPRRRGRARTAPAAEETKPDPEPEPEPPAEESPAEARRRKLRESREKREAARA